MEEVITDEAEFPVYTIGITNKLRSETGVFFQVPFFEIDELFPSRERKKLIYSLFPYDCLRFRSTKGYHYVGFCLLLEEYGFNYNVRAMEVAREVGSDYVIDAGRDLALRVAPKWTLDNEEIKPAPFFSKVIKLPPKGAFYSLEHLRIYSLLSLPARVARIYARDCRAVNLRAAYYKYRTRG